MDFITLSDMLYKQKTEEISWKLCAIGQTFMCDYSFFKSLMLWSIPEDLQEDQGTLPRQHSKLFTLPTTSVDGSQLSSPVSLDLT